jgi:tetratricopeptide (TPR) repeat protein
VRRVLGHLAFTTGDYGLAREHLEIAIPLACETGNELLHTWCLVGFADILLLAGELDQAEARYRLALDRAVGTVPSVVAYVHDGLAQLEAERGDFGAARAASITALRLSEQNAIRQLLISGNLLLAMIDCAVGDADSAAARLDSAEALNPTSAHGQDPYFLIARSEIALVRGRHREALRCAEQAAALADQLNDAEQCDVLLAVGIANLACDRHESALKSFEQVIDKAGRASMRCRVANGREGAAAACAALGMAQEGHTHLAAANEIRSATKSARLPRRPVEELLATLADECITISSRLPRHA